MSGASRCLALWLALVSLGSGESGAGGTGMGYDAERSTLIYGGQWYRHLEGSADPRAVYLRELPAGGEEAIWAGEWPLSDLQISPTGEHIAFREHRSRHGVGLGTDVLRVITNRRRLVATVPAVYRYSWSPEGHEIAYITGVETEGWIGYREESTWVLDLRTGERRQIYDGGRDVSWAGWDGRIYISLLTTDPVKVVAYDRRSRTVGPTEYHGIHFSPDGRYYYRNSSEGEPFELFRRADHRRITGESDFLTSHFGTDRVFQARGWLDRGHLVLEWPFPGETVDFVYDCDSDIAHEVPGRVVAGLRGLSELLVFRQGAFAVQPLESFGLLRP